MWIMPFFVGSGPTLPYSIYWGGNNACEVSGNLKLGYQYPNVRLRKEVMLDIGN